MKKELVFLAPESAVDAVFSRETRERIGSLCRVRCPFVPAGATEDEVADLLRGVEIALSTWGMPSFTPKVLAAAGSLRILIYGASSVKYALPADFLLRPVTVTSAAPVMGRVVAEFTVALMTLCLKEAWEYVRDPKRCAGQFRRERPWKGPGGFQGARIGLIGASFVGRAVLEMLRAYPCAVSVYDPYFTEAEAEEKGVEKCGLESLLSRSDIVSLHAPNIPACRGMIGREQLRLIRDGCWFLNTARGALVDEEALLRELESGRIQACLDVTDPEPPCDGSPLYGLPNVILTPHMAGAINRDCHRLGDSCYDELVRYLEGRPPVHRITAEEFPRLN